MHVCSQPPIVQLEAESVNKNITVSSESYLVNQNNRVISNSSFEIEIEKTNTNRGPENQLTASKLI